MMSQTVLTKFYTEPEFSEKEILRYAGCNMLTDDIAGLIHSCVDEARRVLTYKVCWREFPVKPREDGLDIGFIRINSGDLIKNLSNCHSCVVFGATVGLGIDRLIAKYGRLSPSKALIFQAIGAERIEALCDRFCEELSNEKSMLGYSLKPRFSPGYGDLPVNIQKDIFKVLDCHRKIGLSLNDSMLMSPSKSVTAIVGITDKKKDKSDSKCSYCNNKDCVFRDI